MHGNVWEWCRDGLRTYTKTAQCDPMGGTAAGGLRVVRGGSWDNHAGTCRNLAVAAPPAEGFGGVSPAAERRSYAL